jgi:uncharacterized membrane protein YGL010W
MTVPTPDAPFSEKMAYYKTQHTSRGTRFTHMIGTPVIAAGIPLLLAKPRVGVPMFVGGWLLQIAGHRVFEHNLPSTQGLDHLSAHRGDPRVRAVRRAARATQSAKSRTQAGG